MGARNRRARQLKYLIQPLRNDALEIRPLPTLNDSPR